MRIKQNSVPIFLKEYCGMEVTTERGNSQFHLHSGIAVLSEKIKLGTTIFYEFEDWTQESRKKVTVQRKFKVKKHDDITHVLEQISEKIIENE